MKLEGKAKMLRIHFGEDDKWHASRSIGRLSRSAESSILPVQRFTGAWKAMAPAR